MISHLFSMISQIQYMYREIYIWTFLKSTSDAVTVWIKHHKSFTLSYDNQHKSLFICQFKVPISSTDSHTRQLLSFVEICPASQDLGVSRRDSCVEILLVSAGELCLVHGAEVKEVGGTVDLMVELLGVRQLELILHVGVMSHTWKGHGQHQQLSRSEDRVLIETR